MSDTPETDAHTYGGKGVIGAGYVSADFARTLERQRDEARKEVEGLKGDKARMDLLEKMVVEVRRPRAYGSHHAFYASPEDGDGESYPSDIRKQLNTLKP